MVGTDCRIEFLEIPRQGGFECQAFSGAWVGEVDAPGMEQLARDMADGGDDGRIAWRNAHAGIAWGKAVFRIAHDWVSQMGQMDAYLVRPSGFQSA
jgi:hypothetical protein